MCEVDFSKVEKTLKKLPRHILKKAVSWARDVELFGLPTVRRTPGYHDEPLEGRRFGQRSIRLSRAYRLIYSVSIQGAVKVILIEEINKHEY